MGSTGYVFNAPAPMGYYLGAMSEAKEISEVLEAVQEYLASWSMERIAGLQKIDAGWAPFDSYQKPLSLNDPLAVRCFRDAIHNQCVALRDAGVALTPDLVEIDEFFYAASEFVENVGQVGTKDRRLPTSSRNDAYANY
jgi:hypothetical protein